VGALALYALCEVPSIAQTARCWPDTSFHVGEGIATVSPTCRTLALPFVSNLLADDAPDNLDGYPAAANTVNGSTENPYGVDRYAVRGGVFAHGIGSVERNTFDLNFELVSPRLFSPDATQWWASFIPRLQIGGFLNTASRTSEAYTGALWTIPIYHGFFFEAFIGGAINNGSEDGTATRSALGCTGAFNLGTSLGYNFSSSWSLVGTWNHMSNGNRMLGVDCPHNKGVNNIGLKAGYAF
jgi:hypothetical protein